MKQLESSVVGRMSEYLAINALLVSGWEVCEPVTVKSYDLLARPKGTHEWLKIQVKTAFVRNDRNGDVVVYAKKGNGSTYTKDEADYFIAVLGSRCFLFENREITEYWSSQTNLLKKWVELGAAI